MTPEQYGFINTCLKSLVMEKFGEETWEKLRTMAETQDTFMTYTAYNDNITMRLVTEACTLLGVAPEVVLHLFGEYFFEFCKRSGYDRMLRTLGGNLQEFIENLDALHSYLTLSYKEMNAPSFRVEKREDGRMLLHYYSDRKGLSQIVPGIIGAVARDFFSSDITMEVVTHSEEDERTGKKEHVVFLVTQSAWSTATIAAAAAAAAERQSVAEGGRGAASPGVPATTPRGSRREEAERRSADEGGGAPRPAKKNHWETIRSIVTLGKGRLLRGFQAVFPDTLWVDERTFCNSFPFHVVFDEELRVKQAGVNIQKFVPGLQTMDIRLDEYFTIGHPEVTFTIESIRKFINSQFVLKTRREMLPEARRSQPMLDLRGQMVWMEGSRSMLYLCSPLLRSLEELEERQLHISDIAPHDATRDLILLNQQRLAEMELSTQLERKKEELRVLSKNLQVEKKKTEALLYAMLPHHVANQLKEGKKVEAGEFKVCTILFSDVVTFTNICAVCEPIQIVHMLNAMYMRFDRLTTVHNVYKVETIGDAYMVVGGVPIPVPSHAERVANFALGMVLAAREVTNPVTGSAIQIRVGIHSGPVLAGVVGEKMPRYCLFGDTVNTASRMESHGLPGKIHLSPSTREALQDKEFDVEERGEIEVKGKGRMSTYFLLGNRAAGEQEILGRTGPLPMADAGGGAETATHADEGPDRWSVPMKYSDSGDSTSHLGGAAHSSPLRSGTGTPARSGQSRASLHTEPLAVGPDGSDGPRVTPKPHEGPVEAATRMNGSASPVDRHSRLCLLL
ncbi:guanylate cyclase soluble subunit beta-2-like [Lampetra fluviatilis]